MYSANDVVETFVSEVWMKEVEPYNTDPQRFRLELEGRSCRKELRSRSGEMPLANLYEVLNHLTINSMQAITGREGRLGSQLQWVPPGNPGIIKYRTVDGKNYTAIEVEDNGKGINPAAILTRATKAGTRIIFPINPQRTLDLIFEPRVSTKRLRSGTRGNGLYYCRTEIEALGGSVNVIGTTFQTRYQTGGTCMTVGEHHGQHTGTVIRIAFPFNGCPSIPKICRNR